MRIRLPRLVMVQMPSIGKASALATVSFIGKNAGIWAVAEVVAMTHIHSASSAVATRLMNCFASVIAGSNGPTFDMRM